MSDNIFDINYHDYYMYLPRRQGERTLCALEDQDCSEGKILARAKEKLKVQKISKPIHTVKISKVLNKIIFFNMLCLSGCVSTTESKILFSL